VTVTVPVAASGFCSTVHPTSAVGPIEVDDFSVDANWMADTAATWTHATGLKRGPSTLRIPPCGQLAGVERAAGGES
jgi:hypothetical protein